MPSKRATGRSVAKAHMLKEAAAKEAAAKETSRKRATRGNSNKKNASAPASAMSSVVSASTCASSSVMSVTAHPATSQAQLAVTARNKAPAPNEAPTCNNAPARNEAPARNAAPARSEAPTRNKAATQIVQPRKVKNIQEAMGLENDPGKYNSFRHTVTRYATAAGLDYRDHWSRHDARKVALVGRMARKDHAFLECYVGDWPIKVYLQRHFANQRSYIARCEKRNAAAADMLGGFGDIGDFGSQDERDSDERDGDECDGDGQ